jgi:hypothetical protein
MATKQQERTRLSDTIASFLREWDKTRLGLKNNPLLTLRKLYALTKSTIHPFIQLDVLQELHTRVIDMVHELDFIEEDKPMSQLVMQNIIDISRLNIVLEPLYILTGDGDVVLY